MLLRHRRCDPKFSIVNRTYKHQLIQPTLDTKRPSAFADGFAFYSHRISAFSALGLISIYMEPRRLIKSDKVKDIKFIAYSSNILSKLNGGNDILQKIKELKDIKTIEFNSELFEYITKVIALIIYIGFMFGLLFWLVGIV